jgi:hypothetical protein
LSFVEGRLLANGSFFDRGPDQLVRVLEVLCDT